MPQYNAIVLRVGETFQKVHVDFSRPDAVAEAIGAEGVRILHTLGTLELGERIGQHLCGAYDRYADEDADSNAAAEELTGYEFVPGDILLCGCNSKYEFEPLTMSALFRLVEALEELECDEEAPRN